MKLKFILHTAVLAIAARPACADIGLISAADAKKLIENTDVKKRPVVLDTRGGYKDYFRGHLPTAHHLEFDTLRGTDAAVPVQYLPDDLTKTLLLRAGVDKDRLYLVYATGAELPNDEILSTSMVVFVLEKFGVKDIRVVDGGLAEWKKQGFEPARDYFGNPPGSLPKEGNPTIAANISDVLEVKEEEAAFARRAAVGDDVFVLGDAGLLQFRLHLVERSELVRVILLHQPRPVKADCAGDVALT